jgi:Flp pilus assembly CpaE family ATPase
VAKGLFDEMGTNFEVLLVSPNPRLKEAIEQIERVTLTLHRPQWESGLDVKAVIVDGQTVHYRDLPRIREHYPHQQIFYLLHNVTNQIMQKNIQTICATYSIHVLPDQWLPYQTAAEINRILFQHSEVAPSRVVAFFGTHSGAGVSTTCLNVARFIGAKVEEKVCVLSLNPWDASDYFLPYQGQYLNDMKVELKSGTFNQQTLRSAVCKYSTFYHLAGNSDIKLQRYYKVEEIERLIRAALQEFDLVLIDAGTHFDNACYAQSYKMSDLKFLVTTQEPKGYRGYFPRIYQQLLQPIGVTTDEFMLVINQYQPDLSLITDKDLAEELDMSLLTNIPSELTMGQVAIAQKKMLYDLGSSGYRQAIQRIGHSIISRAKLTVRHEPEWDDKRSVPLWKKLFGNKETQQEREE